MEHPQQNKLGAGLRHLDRKGCLGVDGQQVRLPVGLRVGGGRLGFLFSPEEGINGVGNRLASSRIQSSACSPHFWQRAPRSPGGQGLKDLIVPFLFQVSPAPKGPRSARRPRSRDRLLLFFFFFFLFSLAPHSGPRTGASPGSCRGCALTLTRHYSARQG